MRAALLVVFLAGCAANQSAFPMPPVFSPVEDAPITIGHPGTVAPGPKPERGTDRRVLPQTPETRRQAGIWASDGDEPRAAIRRVGTLTLLQVPLPLPVIDGSIVAPGPAERCVATYHRLFLMKNFWPALNLIETKAGQECLVAKLYDLCAKTTSKAFPKNDSDPAFAGIGKEDVQRTRANTNLTRQVADSFKNEKCHARSDTAAVKRAFGEIADVWLKMFPQGAI